MRSLDAVLERRVRTRSLTPRTPQVIEVNVPNPYAGSAKYLNRFRHSLNKLYAWGLTQYRRVVMIDADVIAFATPTSSSTAATSARSS